MGVLLALPLMCCGYPHGTHDGGGHLNWVECFSRQLWGGELYPRWLSAPNNGFGSPSFFFYGPLSYHVGAVFWRLAPLGAPAGFALGWAAALALILSGVGAFWCLRRFAVNQWAASIGAIVYMAAPYHLAIDLLDRGANAEFWAFVWLPLIIGTLEDLGRAAEGAGNRNNMAGLLWTQEDVPKVLKLGLLLAGLLFTHVLTAIVFAPVAAAFALSRGWRTFRGLLTAGVVALGLSAIYWLPLVAFQCLTNGSRWDWTNGDDLGKTVFFSTLKWSKPLVSDDAFNRRLFHIFLGFALVGVIGLLAAWNLKFDRPVRRRMMVWILVLAGCLAMMLPISLPIYSYASPLRYIQFSWRFLGCATLAHSLLVAFLLDAFWKKAAREGLSRLRLWLGRVAAAAVLVVAVYWAAVLGAEKYREGYFDKGKLQPTPPGANVSAPDAHGEYTPVSANEEEALHLFPNAGSAAPRLLEGAGRVAGTPKSARHWTLDIQATSPCRVVVPQYWFPGWKASGSGLGEEFPVQSESKSGLVQIEVPAGRHLVDLRLGALWPELVGRWVSLGTVCGLGLVAALLGCRKRHPQEIIAPVRDENTTLTG